MKKQSVDRDFLILAILSIIAVAVWIAADIYQALNKSEIPKVLQKQTEPLNPKIETSILEELEKQNYYDWGEYQAPPEIKVEETPQATEEAESINP